MSNYPNIVVYSNDIFIEDSCEVSKRDFKDILMKVSNEYPSNAVVINRTIGSMKREWAAHNLLYNLNIERDRTKDVDLNYPQKWYCKIGYFFLGTIGLIFIK